VDSPFEVLGIDPDADEEEIVRAYRRRVKEAHPDHGGSRREFQRVRSAYEELRSGVERHEVEGAGRDRDVERRGRDQPRESERRGRETGRRDRESGQEEAQSGPEGARVEYLNFEVIDDHGWSLDDDDLFEKASDADLDPADYGQILVQPRESLLEAAENRGFAWPFACRGGACTNCAVMVVEGEIPTPPGHILPQELLDRGIRLSCISAPTTAEAKVVYNVKHLPDVDELRLPASRFENARATD
jgi:curved DNA-binding protein CbpA